ncbi:MAG TPA: hypothetical protein PKI87_06280 [Arenimonas sp.]|nr:hypothetical protein [Arenimonas sp.]
MAERSKLAAGPAVKILLILLFVGLAWRVFSLGMADTQSRFHPQQALQWKPRHSAALFLLAEQQAANANQHGEAKRNAMAALRAYPLEGRAYRILGQIADAEKKPDQAFVLYQKAVHYSPRDLESHLWLLNYSLRTENAELAVHHLDRLLRMQIDLLPPLIPTIAGLATQPSSQDALIKAMLKNPSWRLPAINTLTAQQGASTKYAVFFDRLGKTHGSLSEREQQAWLGALNLDQQWPLAYLTWASQLPAATQLELGNLFNGSFEHEPLPGGFDWQFDEVPGASIDLESRDGISGNKALHLNFEGRRVPFNGVRQTLVLPAGSYRFSGKGLADNLMTELGLVWSVQCLGSGEILASGEPWKGRSAQWQAFSLDFTVPKEHCTAQSVFLKLPARIAAEQEIAGSLWFDAFRIQRIQGLTERDLNH